MTHSEREAELLIKVARLRQNAEDLAEELNEAGLEKTASSVRLATTLLDGARQMLMTAIRDAGEAAGRKR